MNENGMGPIEASPSLPRGDWWSSTPLDRLTSRPVAQQLFSPSANWQPGPLVWGWTSLSRAVILLSASPSFSLDIICPLYLLSFLLVCLSTEMPPPLFLLALPASLFLCIRMT